MKFNLGQKIASKLFGGQITSMVRLGIVKELTKKGKSLGWTPKSIYHTRSDIKTWNESQDLFYSVDDPKTYAMQLLYNEIKLDAHLTSQIENRKQQVFSSSFTLKNAKGDIDEVETLKLKKSMAYRVITDAMLETEDMGNSLLQLDITADKKVLVQLVPRTNVVPQKGLFYRDYTGIEKIEYRNLPDYGKWLIEFNAGHIGLLNKAIPHVLFKRFAQSCWSELCEIYGIPPRVMKTNTQDPSMLSRAETMMKDMGAAAWFIIDETESFEFAKAAADSSGNVYDGLIKLCNNEISLLKCGAIIGQDTVNGNRSKDESARDVLWQLVKSDMEKCEQWWNEIVLPAFVKIGAMPDGLSFEFDEAEDIKQLFEFTKGLLPFKKVDDAWCEEKFGVKVLGDKDSGTGNGNNNSNLSYFFD